MISQVKVHLDESQYDAKLIARSFKTKRRNVLEMITWYRFQCNSRSRREQ